jgi:hypothetical protein
MPAPAISSLSVASGTPGTPLRIDGRNFGPQRPQSTVQLRLRAPDAPTAVAPIDDWKNTRIEVRVPALDRLGSGGVADLWVRSADGESQRVQFTVREPTAPVLEEVEPAAAIAGDVVTLSGSGFGIAQFGTAAVLVSDRSGSEVNATVRAWSATHIEIAVPGAAALGGPGDKQVRVRTLWGDSGSIPLTISAPPTLNAVRVPERPDEPVQALPGDELVTEGVAFGARDAQSAVLVATPGEAPVPAQIEEWTGERIRFLFPDGTGEPGPRQVSVRTRSGTSTSATVLLEGVPTLSAAPVAMLPLALQTRFMVSGTELWVRAIPDMVHVDSHDGRLTEEEAELGERYRNADAAGRADVWLDMSTRFGTPRAEWIVRSTVAGNVTRRNAPWARAARSRLLPRRLYAFAYDDDGQLLASQHGRPIPFELPIGPDPTAPADSDPSQDAGIRWMVDFDEALARGMAIKLRLPDPPPTRISRLVVVGAETSLTSAEGAAELVSALTAHRYTRGIGFLPEGTPTNNTPAVTDSGDSHGQPPDVLVSPDAATNAGVAARALGITAYAAEVFSGTPHAAEGKALRRARRSMNAALWPATWGYFLEHMLAPEVAHGSLESGREHFVEWVRACGPQPVLRIGEQPLGLLPVVPLAEWAPNGEEALEPLAKFLQEKLSPIWNASVAGVPRVSDEPPTQDETDENPLLTVLSMQPTSISFRGRSVLGMEFVEAASRFIRNRLSLDPRWKTEQRDRARAVLDAHGLESWDPNVVRTVFAANYFPIELPLVYGGEQPRSGPLPTNSNWLSLLHGAGWKALRDDAFVLNERPLLYLLLRHSLLAAYLMTAGDMLPADPWRGGEPVHYGIDEIDDNLDAPRPALAWDRLEASGKGAALDAQAQGLLLTVRDAVRELAGKPVEVLERAAAETLDLCSHRLDAWITSFAHRRLHAIRGETGADGLHLGAFGMVENIQRGDGGGSAGYVHTPSPAHASAAAILASGYRSHPEGGGTRHPFGIDLSSERVRLALSLLDGVRAGHQLGALLGYRFERSMQESGLARFIEEFREIAPLPVAGTAEPNATVESVAVQNVADGLELHRRWVAAGREPEPGWPNGSTQQNDALQNLFEGLDDVVDALGDILVTEGVFQLARGNAERAAAALEAAARPSGTPPELEAIYTPHSGVAAIHRLAVMLPGEIAFAPDWEPDAALARRAAAEPRFDAWAGRLLGDPKRVRYRVEYQDPTSGAVIAEEERRLDQLAPALSPLDVVYAAVASERTQLSEIEQRIVYDAVRTRPAGVPPDAQVRVVGSRQPELEHKIGLLELMELAQSLREAISGARALAPDDLSVPEVPGGAIADVKDIEDRSFVAETDLRAAHDALGAAIATPAGEALRSALLAASALGIPGAVPLSAFGDEPSDRADLSTQATIAQAEVARRIADLDALPTPTDEIPRRIEHALSRLGCVFGSDFRAAPLYTAPPAGNPAQLDVRFSASAGLLDGDRFAAARWFQRLTRVREGARRLGDALLYADALGGADTLSLAVAQLPAVPGDRWLGLPFADGTPPVGRVSLVAHLPVGPLDVAGTLAGLVFEEFIEVLASPTKTTGLALHYDQPDVTPPQAIVLAVPPRLNEDWTWTLTTLEATVHATFELAKMRMVDLDVLQEAGHFLPATYLGLNMKGVTVATDFLAGRGLPLA